MKLNEYQKLALNTLKKQDHKTNLTHGFCGLITELGELVDIYKKHKFYGKEYDKNHIREEIGDFMWYLAILYEEMGVTMPEEMSKDFPPSFYNINIDFLLSKITAVSFRGFALVNIYFDTADYMAIDIIKDSLGWLHWLAAKFDITLEDAADINIAKLKARYPEGFNENKALNRNLEEEQKIIAS